MGVEKEGSKGGSKEGSKVGGFLHMFDWTAKSRKKLFSGKSDFPERSKQGKRRDGNLPMTQLNLMDEDDIGAGSSVKGSSDYSCASSVTDDDIYGAKAPGVVARLMGLDTLPTSSTEPYATPLFDTQSLRSSRFSSRSHNFQHDQQIMYSGNLFGKVDGPVKNFVESKPHKIVNRPIEKFQTESLPPKSAKSISITHHKLLSPIKSPGYFPTKNAAHIMEAAAKIIDASPQAPTRFRMPSVGSSSGPLKVRDLKEKLESAQKMPPIRSSSAPTRVRDGRPNVEASDRTSRLAEATRRPVESNAAKYLKGQSLNKSWNGSTDSTSPRFYDMEESSGTKNKGKSISLAIQAKVNVQRREGLSGSSGRSLLYQRDQSEMKSVQVFSSQPSGQKNLHKRSSSPTASSVLRQNNQKQNCQIDKNKSSSKSTVSNLQSRKDSRQKALRKTVQNSKTGSRKLGLDVTDYERGGPYMKNHPRKKRSIDGEFHFEKNEVADNMLVDRSHKAVDSNAVSGRHFNWVEDSKKKGMDVVSFTFTAPLTRPMETSSLIAQRSNSNSTFVDNSRCKRLLLDTESMNLSSLGHNPMGGGGGDALSILLEQKLRELNYAIESSSHESLKSMSSSNTPSTSHNLVESPAASTASRFSDKLSSCYSSSLSTNLQELKLNNKFQGVDEMDECSSSRIDARQPSPVSVLDSSFSTESCGSSDSMDSSSIVEGSKQCSSVQAQDVHILEADTELSDSASSLSITMKSVQWELEYVNLILCNVELMFKDFALGRAREIINPHLFHQLENRKTALGGFTEESKLQRKVLFDCVSECLDLRFRRYVGGGSKMWAKGVGMLRRKEWLAEEVYREISTWRGMGDCMVDELVDKDMSTQHGKWLDFEVDGFVLGSEVEGQIFDALVEEVVYDIMQVKCFRA